MIRCYLLTAALNSFLPYLVLNYRDLLLKPELMWSKNSETRRKTPGTAAGTDLSAMNYLYFVIHINLTGE